MHIKNRKWSVIAVVIFVIATVFLFNDLVFHPASRVVSLGGDGCKNMFTYLYHVMYGGGAWFRGMNYPFGEHIVFTDATPALSVPLAWLNKSLNLSPGTILGIMYYCMALSFVLAMWYVYRLLLHFRVAPLLAIAASVLTLFLSPQVFRITGHFALCYSCIMPMLFYWTVIYYETNRLKYPVFIFLLCTLASFVHMYFLGLSLLWMMAYGVGGLLFRKEGLAARLKHVCWLGAAVVLAFITVQAAIKLTDPIHDRPVYPFWTPGWKHLLALTTTVHSPIWKALKDGGIVSAINENVEGTVYAGIVTLAMMAAGFILWLKQVRKPGTTERIPFQYIWLFMAMVTLAFAVGIPKIWDTGIFKTLLKPLRQFRATERFSWIFYYVMSVYAAVILQQLVNGIKAGGKQALSVAIAVLVVAVWSVDASGNIRYLRRESGPWAWNYEAFFSVNQKSWTTFLKERGRSPKDFEALLVVPYVHVGSEKLWRNDFESYSLTMAYMLVTELNLPLMDVMMSRSSWQQTFDQVKIDGGIYVHKPILDSLKRGKPILLLHYEEYKTTPDMECIFRASDTLGSQNGCALYAFYPERLRKAQQQEKLEISHVAATQQSSDTMIRSAAPYFIRHFDEQPSPLFFAGTGGQAAIRGKDSVITEWMLPSVMDSLSYEFSIWSKSPEVGPRQNSYTIVFKDNSDKELGRVDALTTSSVDNAPGFWFRTNKFFVFPEGTAKLSVIVINEHGDNYIAHDELVIRPVQGIVISKMKDGKVLVNNHNFAANQ